MRGASFIRPGLVEWRELPEPCIQRADDALVRPMVVGRCDLDVAYMRGLLPMPGGAPIGHEIIAEIVEVGGGVADRHVGERVFVPAQISCGACTFCRRGLTGRCAAVPFAASYGMGREGGFGGGLADLVRVPFASAMLTPVPHGVAPETLIGAADMAADAHRAVVPALVANPGARVLVLGGLPPVIGLYAAGLAVARAACEVCYVDADAKRGLIARRYGARYMRDLAEVEGDFDIVVVANPSPDALAAAFRFAAPGATVTSVTPTIGEPPRMETAQLYHKGVTWRIGRPDCRHAHDGTMCDWANHGFRPDLIPTTLCAWEDAPAAWASDALYVAAVRS